MSTTAASFATSPRRLSFTFKDLARQLYTTGGGITGTASLDPTGEGNSFGVHLVDVEVDPDTGKTEILRYTAIQDAGKAVHPSYVEGQIQGGAVQGIGWALNEEYYFSDNGQMMNSSFLDYRMPTSLDLPMIDTGYRGSGQPRPSLRRARRWRGSHRAPAGRHRQRRWRSHRPAPDQPAHHPGQRAGSGVERKIV